MFSHSLWSQSRSVVGDPSEPDISLTVFDSTKVFTSAIPFNDDLSHTAMSAIVDGKRPPRPTHPTLTDWLWALTQQCWDQEASRRPRVSEVLQVLHSLSVPIFDHESARLTSTLCSGRSAWNRLITSPLTPNQRTSLITEILSDRDEIETINNLCGNDAQSFIDVIDEVAPELFHLRTGPLTFIPTLTSR